MGDDIDRPGNRELRDDKSGARTRYCRDCRHIVVVGNQYDLATCGRKEAVYVPSDTLVSGIGNKTQRFCSSMRFELGPCGTEGRLWEQRQ